jgi:hypothetical protein
MWRKMCDLFDPTKVNLSLNGLRNDLCVGKARGMVAPANLCQSARGPSYPIFAPVEAIATRLLTKDWSGYVERSFLILSGLREMRNIR